MRRTRARRDKVAHIRLSEQEFSAVDAAARNLGLSLSSFLRSLVLEGAGHRPFLSASDQPIIKLLAEDLRFIGNSLNELTRALNASNSVDSSVLLASVQDARGIVMAVGAELILMTKKAGSVRRGDDG